jgi:hypothetical protein
MGSRGLDALAQKPRPGAKETGFTSTAAAVSWPRAPRGGGSRAIAACSVPMALFRVRQFKPRICARGAFFRVCDTGILRKWGKSPRPRLQHHAGRCRRLDHNGVSARHPLRGFVG